MGKQSQTKKVKIEVKEEHIKQEEKQKKIDKEKKGKGKKNRLIIRNLIFDVREKHLRKLLSPFGEIVDLQVPTNPNNPQLNKGFAFV